MFDHENMFHCERCDFMCVAKQYMVGHKEMKHNGMQYSCAKCG